MYRHMFAYTLTQQKDSTKINGPSFLLKDSELSSDLVGKTDAIGSWMKELHFGGASLKSKNLWRGPILDDTRCPFVFVFRIFSCVTYCKYVKYVYTHHVTCRLILSFPTALCFEKTLSQVMFYGCQSSMTK